MQIYEAIAGKREEIAILNIVNSVKKNLNNICVIYASQKLKYWEIAGLSKIKILWQNS